jgi:hypothetical protein
MALTNLYTGAHGTLGIAVEGTPVQQADFNAINDAYGTSIVGRVTDVEVCVQTELKEFYTIGSRETVTLYPGNVHISGKVGRAYINGALLFLLLGRGATGTAEPTIQPKFTLNLILQNPHFPDSRLRLNVQGVKFENWAVNLPQETFVMEQVTFKAVRMGVADVDEGSDITVAFP